MAPTSIYFCGLVFLTITVYARHGKALGKLIVSLYFAVSVVTMFAVNGQYVKTENITFMPYLFLLLIYVISFFPYFNKSNTFSAEFVDYYLDKKYVIFLWIYIVSASISIFCFLPEVIRLQSIGNWLANRTQLYSGEMTFPYSNIIEYLAMQISGYFRLLALIVSFICMCKSDDVNDDIDQDTDRVNIAPILAVATGIMSMLLSSVYTSSRGGIVNAFSIFIALFVFFFARLKKNYRRLIIITCGALVFALVPYFVAVTISRFSSESAFDSVISYIGQPPVVFNYGVFNISSLGWGKMGFGMLFGQPFTESMVGGKWNTGFYTFVGWMYIDWGAFGTIIISSIVSLFVNFRMKHSVYYVSDVFLIFCFVQFLLEGVFVIGRAYCYPLIINIVIYIFLRCIVERYRFKIGNIII